LKVDLAKLKLFVEVLESGSITAGAARCHLSVAAASHRLQELEGALAVKLFDRSKAGVIPTEAGHELAKHARSVLQEVDRLRNEMEPFSRGVRGRVRIVANTAALSAYLPDPLSRFLSAHPEIDVDVQEQWSGEILESLRRERADVGILANTVDTSDFNAIALAEDNLVVVGSRQRLQRLSEKPSFEECIALPLVGLSEASALYTFLQNKASLLGKAIHYRVRVRTFEGVLRMASLDVGVSIVSDLATHAVLTNHPTLECRPLSDSWATRMLVLCTGPSANPPPYVRLLIDFLTTESRLNKTG
jgi:DNA-binding transcriptional LysR family regulator